MPQAKFRSLLLWIVVATTVLAGIWPRESTDENRVAWRNPGPGLVFDDSSQCLGEEPLWIDTGAVTLELWLESEGPEGRGNSEILSLVDAPSVHRLLVGQFQGGLILRGRLDNPRGDPKRDHYADHWPHDPLRHLAVTIESGGALLYANGRRTSLALPATVAEHGVPFGGRLILGTSDSNWTRWRGSIFALAVHDRILKRKELAQHAEFGMRQPNDRSRAMAELGLKEISEVTPSPGLVALYLLEEGTGSRASSHIEGAPDLIFPKRFIRPLATTLLTGPYNQRWNRLDIVLNVLGFVPFGFVIAWRRPRGLWVALACGIALSLSIELSQPWIPGRDSSLIDWFCNSAGALAGGLLAALESRVISKIEAL
jgi:hypothetical protein